MSERDEELIAAYLDGVGELSADERRRAEELLRARPDTAAGMKSTLDALRALPPEGHEPDWAVLEREIRAAVGPTVPSRRLLRWIAPLGALAVTATVALVLFRHPHAAEPAHAFVPGAAAPVAAHEPAATTLYLDGQVVEVEDVDPAVLLDDGAAGDPLATGANLLPVQDLGWVDSLDDTAIERAERWLDGKQKG